jgi:hypothetical protein
MGDPPCLETDQQEHESAGGPFTHDFTVEGMEEHNTVHGREHDERGQWSSPPRARHSIPAREVLTVRSFSLNGRSDGYDAPWEGMSCHDGWRISVA